MIDSLSGTLLEKTAGEAVIECAGVGYLVSMPAPSVGALPAVGGRVTVYTRLHLTENDAALYGFASREEREMFRLLTSVSGVGPKVGLAILSALSASAIALAAAGGDYKAFTAASGVGPKLAQRLVLELKDKVGQSLTGGSLSASDLASPAAPAGAAQQAVSALIGLGYTQAEAARAVAGVDPSLPAAEIIRLALRGIGST